MKLSDIRLSTRITAGMLLLVAVSALAWIAVENRRLHEAYLMERGASLESALQVKKSSVAQSIETLRQDVIFLANVPPISGIVRAASNDGLDPRDNNPYATWEKRLQEIFAAFLRARPEYFQARYIGVANGGLELVRVDRVQGNVEVVPRERLQAKGERDYFSAGLGLTLGRVHLSEFNLNQEWGIIETPHRPTLRAVTPVFDARGRVFGLVVVNMDAGALLQLPTTGLPSGVETYVADERGRYLLHPDAKRAFAFELGESRGVADDFPALADMYVQRTPDHLPLHEVDDPEGRQYLAAQRIYFDASAPSRFLVLAYRLPPAAVAGQTTRIVWPRIVDALLVMLAVGAVLMLMLRRTFAPLKRITADARTIAAGDRQLRIHGGGGGELGELADALNVMIDKLAVCELTDQENAYFREMIDSLPGIFYMLDAGGHFLMWNRNLTEVLQCSDEQMAVSHSLDFFVGEDRPRIEAAIRQVFEKGYAGLDAELVASDGSRTAYRFTGRRIRRDGALVLVGLGLDISGMQASLHELDSVLRRNQALMQSSMEGIHVMDIDGRLFDVNDAFCHMLGYTREEAMRLNMHDWDDQYPEEVIRQHLREFIGKSDTFEAVHKRKDGSLLDVEVCATGVEIDGKGYVFASSRDITARKKMQQVLERHHRVVETAMDGYWMTSDQGFLEEVNQAYADMVGYGMQELVGMHISQLEANEKPEDVRAHIEKIMVLGHDRFETRHRCKDGKLVDLEISVAYDEQNHKFLVFCHDITWRKRVEDEVRVAAAAFETQDAIVITDAHSNIIRVNRAFTAITGYAPEEVMGRNPRIMSSGRHDQDFYAAMWQQIAEKGSWAGEIWDRRKNGEIYPKWLTITAVKNGLGEITQYVAIFSDITERKRAEEEIRNLAFYDALTQLPNRRLFQERFHAALAASDRFDDYGAILFLDLDRFKLLNDTLGHEYGDLLLVEVAKRLRACVREMDTVARLGGDEFVVLLESISTEREDASHKVGLVAEKIREVLAQPYQLREHEHYSSPSIGITLFHGNDESMDMLTKHADAAMYHAKSAGRNAVRFYDPGLQLDLETRAMLENELRRAIENGELQLYYQVQVDSLHHVVGLEALIRWLHPQRGMVSPARFIPVAEESSIIIDIGNWVLDTACAQLAAWQADPRMSGLTLAVNVSAHQFRQPDFVQRVESALHRHRVEPARLKLELTESVVLDDLGEVADRMRVLKELGVLLSLDDFGTGYSSLSYLKRLPLDQIKIDQSFVRDIADDPDSAMMVCSIIDMARNFHLDVIAEGVETEAQLAFLAQKECLAYQGYLFGKPVPVQELKAVLDRLEQKTGIAIRE